MGLIKGAIIGGALGSAAARNNDNNSGGRDRRPIRNLAVAGVVASSVSKNRNAAQSQAAREQEMIDIQREQLEIQRRQLEQQKLEMQRRQIEDQQRQFNQNQKSTKFE